MKFYGKFYVVHSNVRVCIQEYDVDKNKLPDESLQGVCGWLRASRYLATVASKQSDGPTISFIIYGIYIRLNSTSHSECLYIYNTVAR